MSQSDNEFLDETALLEESDNVEAEGDLSYENGEEANDPVSFVSKIEFSSIFLYKRFSTFINRLRVFFFNFLHRNWRPSKSELRLWRPRRKN